MISVTKDKCSVLTENIRIKEEVSMFSLKEKEVNTGRQRELDLVKGFLLIMIVFIHSFQTIGGVAAAESNVHKILFALFMCILNGISIRRFLNYRQEMKKTFILPTIASGIMGGAAYGVYKLVHMTVKSNTIGVLLAIVVAVMVYGVLLLKLRCVDETELAGMPGGTKLVRIAQKCHLM